MYHVADLFLLCSRYVNSVSKINMKVQDGCREHQRGYESTIGKENRGPIPSFQAPTFLDLLYKLHSPSLTQNPIIDCMEWLVRKSTSHSFESMGLGTTIKEKYKKPYCHENLNLLHFHAQSFILIQMDSLIHSSHVPA